MKNEPNIDALGGNYKNSCFLVVPAKTVLDVLEGRQQIGALGVSML